MEFTVKKSMTWSRGRPEPLTVNSCEIFSWLAPLVSGRIMFYFFMLCCGHEIVVPFSLGWIWWNVEQTLLRFNTLCTYLYACCVYLVLGVLVCAMVLLQNAISCILSVIFHWNTREYDSFHFKEHGITSLVCNLGISVGLLHKHKWFLYI